MLVRVFGQVLVEGNGSKIAPPELSKFRYGVSDLVLSAAVASILALKVLYGV